MSTIQLFDLEPSTSDFRADVIHGLSQKKKSIPPKYLYDERGSQIFDAICELEEYYPTRTEKSILNKYANAIDKTLPERCQILEYGSGSSDKIRRLLSESDKIQSYIPLDISKEHLIHSAEQIAESYPQLEVKAVCADYTDDKIASFDPGGDESRVVFFPGSTIGNLSQAEALSLMDNTNKFLDKDGLFIVGIDLIKSEEILKPAYDDSKGVTADFNLNLLKRINRELDGSFDLETFHHEARFNQEEGRIEMHLRSETEQSVRIGDNSFSFAAGETIHTENSRKFHLDSFTQLAAKAGLKKEKAFTDPKEHFAVLVMSSTAKAN